MSRKLGVNIAIAAAVALVFPAMNYIKLEAAHREQIRETAYLRLAEMKSSIGVCDSLSKDPRFVEIMKDVCDKMKNDYEDVKRQAGLNQ